MSEELNDDMVIGIVAEAVQDGPNTYHSEPIPVTPNDLDEKNREYWRIGKGACEAADKANPYVIGLLAGGLWLVVAGRPKQSCPIELIQTLDEAHTHGYAAGLACAEKRIAELEDSLNVIDKDRECYYAPVIAEKDRRIAELERELAEVTEQRDVTQAALSAKIKDYEAALAVDDRTRAELEHELEIARALQPPPPEPEMTLGSAASTEGLVAAKPTGWVVEIRNWGGSVWSAFLIFPDGFEQEMEYTTTNGTPDDVKVHPRVQFIVKDLHAEVVVVPMEKKGDSQ